MQFSRRATQIVVVPFQEFGGFGTNAMQEAQSLRQDLIQDGLSFMDGAFAYAVYDPPTKWFHRHNEIWVAARDSVSGTQMASNAL